MRLFWTGLGFAALMLIGVSAYALGLFASHAFTKPTHARAVAVIHSQDDAFIPLHPVPEMSPGHIRPATNFHPSAPVAGARIGLKSASLRPAVVPSMSGAAGEAPYVPGIRVAANSKGGKGDFQTIVSHLSPTEELPKLRDAYRAVEQLMNTAVKEGDFAAAMRWRDRARNVRSKDPALLTEKTRQAMLKAVETEDFEAATKYRDQLNTLKRYLPEYKLAGRWHAQVSEQGGAFLGGIELLYDGDTLTARYDGYDGGSETGATRELRLFEVDVSGPQESSEGNMVFNGHTQVVAFPKPPVHFKGTGYVGGRPYPGKLYLMSPQVIGFSLEPRPTVKAVNLLVVLKRGF